MATNTVASRPWLYLLLAFLSMAMVTSAGNVTTNATNLLPPVVARPSMQLSLHADDNPNVPCNHNMPCRILPLTVEAGLEDSDPPELNGTLSMVQEDDVNPTSKPESIVYLSCDSPDAPQQLNALMEEEPVAITLYSTTRQNCDLEGDDIPYRRIYTMTNTMDSRSLKQFITPLDDSASSTISARIARSSDVVDEGQQQTGANSAVAMSILYSITGLITLLFLLIIVSGAVRAQRHPERYGPRAGHAGRPRQSRAKGLARALLDTIPIVKFGDQQPDKPDPGQELESNSYQRAVETSPASDEARQTEQQGSHPVPLKSTAATATAAPGSISRPDGVSEPIAEMSPADASQARGDLIGCSICTEDFTVGDDVRVLPCDHKYHPACIDPWLVNVSGTCPLCRLDLRPPSAGNDAPTPIISDQYSLENREARFMTPRPRVGSDAVVDSSHPNRRSRFLDWNRLRHAPIDERIHALRQYRDAHHHQTTGAGADTTAEQIAPAATSNENQGRPPHAGLTERLREKFHIRTRRQQPPGGGEDTT